MQQSGKRIISLLVSLGLLLGAIVIFSTFIRPTYADVQQIKGELLSRRNVLEVQQSAVGQVSQLIESYQGEGELAQTISLALPGERNESQVVHALGQLAEAEGLQVQSLSVTAPGVRNVASGGTSLIKPTGTVQVQLRVTGGYAGFERFLSSVETNLRIMDIRRVTVSPSGAAGNVFDFGVTVETYYQTE